jgi:4-amino-4-deoxy-L-arabinose transferase-like glycosyltransferase
VLITAANYVLAVATLLLAGASGWAWYRGRATAAMVLLMGSAFALRLFMARLDPFVHDWDERYHALVARNLMAYPLQPMLRVDTWFPYDYRAWCCNHVWLHKQPLFMWQMALAMKLFGSSAFTLRLPSALLSSLVLWPIYRLGSLAFGDKLAGYLGAVLGAFAYYQLELVSGAIGMDHNDVAFLAYVTGSIWAYYEYRAQPRWGGWLVLVGVLAGAAVLCKWLTGLAVFAGWGIDVLLHLRQRRPLPELTRLLGALLVAVAVLLPWQLYTAWRFPAESTYESTYNAQHFTTALEGHDTSWTFHFGMLPFHYGPLVLGLLGVGAGLALTKRYRRDALPLLALIVLVFGFFTVAATRMYSYTYVLSPLLLLVAALPLAVVGRWLAARPAPMRWLLGGAGMAAVVLADLRPWGIAAGHTAGGNYGMLEISHREQRVHSAQIYTQLAQELPASSIIFNAPYGQEVEAMFYAGQPVYGGIPSEATVQRLRTAGVHIAIFPKEEGELPPYLRTPDVQLLWGPPR